MLLIVRRDIQEVAFHCLEIEAMMSSKHNPRDFSNLPGDSLERGSGGQIQLSVSVPTDLVSAVEGWRNANNLKTTDEALETLVRLGLLGEIAKTYETVKRIQKNLD